MNSTLELIRSKFEAIGNPQGASAMQAYMKDLFPYFGIKSAARREACKEFLIELKKDKGINWNFIFDCFEQEEREFQYVGTDYLRKVQRKLRLEDLQYLRSLILSKSWWDTVDALAMEVGAIFLKNPEAIHLLESWITDDNMWIRRVAIIHQLKFKKETNLHFLTRAIENNLGSKEFFINKAIGWSLRSYGDTNPEWVIDFANNHQLAPLSRKEALRKIT